MDHVALMLKRLEMQYSTLWVDDRDTPQKLSVVYFVTTLTTDFHHIYYRSWFIKLAHQIEFDSYCTTCNRSCSHK